MQNSRINKEIHFIFWVIQAKLLSYLVTPDSTVDMLKSLEDSIFIHQLLSIKSILKISAKHLARAIR